MPPMWSWSLRLRGQSNQWENHDHGHTRQSPLRFRTNKACKRNCRISAIVIYIFISENFTRLTVGPCFSKIFELGMGFPTLQTLCTRERYLSNETPGRFLQVRSAQVWKLTLQKTRRRTPSKCDCLGSRASWLFRTRMDIITLINCKPYFQSIIQFVNLFINWPITITWQLQVISPNAKIRQFGKKQEKKNLYSRMDGYESGRSQA